MWVPGRYVITELDAIAVRARNDWVAGRTELNTIILLMCTEDIPEFVIQMV